MSTEQNYVGRGTYATLTEQTAKQDTPAAQIKARKYDTRAEWQRNFLRETLDHNNSEYLFHLLDLVKGQTESYNPIPSLNEMLSNWIDNPTINLNDSDNRLHLRNITTLVTFLTELNTFYFCFNNETDFTNKVEDLYREVDNE